MFKGASIVAGVILIAFLISLRAQDFSSLSSAGINTVPVSSVRAAFPMLENDPGSEGQLAMNDLYLATYHNGKWKLSPRISFPIPAVPTPKP